MLTNAIKYLNFVFIFLGKVVPIITIALALFSCSSSVRYSSDVQGEKLIQNETKSSNASVSYNKQENKTQEMKFRGYASFYSDKFHGQKTSNGEIYDKEKLTAAHPQLPFGTIVEVRNLSNNKTVRVKINDRGPFITGRIIDLSRAAAYALDMIKAGIIEVEITIISIP